MQKADLCWTRSTSQYPMTKIAGIMTNDKLDFNLHNDKICLKSANELNTLVRLKCSQRMKKESGGNQKFYWGIFFIGLWEPDEE